MTVRRNAGRLLGAFLSLVLLLCSLLPAAALAEVEDDLMQVDPQECLVPKEPHVKVHVPAKGPTCTEPGRAEHWVCHFGGSGEDRVDTNLYASSDNTDDTKLTSPWEGSPLGHDFTGGEILAGSCPADCRSEGRLVRRCSRCSETDAQILPVDSDAHDLMHVPAKEPTAKENGCLEHWRCRLCGSLFADPAGEKELSAGDVILGSVPFIQVSAPVLKAEEEDGEITLSVSVRYGNLDESEEYTSRLTLLDEEGKKESESILQDFSADGSAVTMTVPVSDFLGQSLQPLVEILDAEGNIIASNAEDLPDAVLIEDPRGAFLDVTGLSADGPDGNDLVTAAANARYKGLTPGRNYILTAVLTDCARGTDLLVNGEKVFKDYALIPEKSAGVVPVSLSAPFTAVAGCRISIRTEIRDADGNLLAASSGSSEGGGIQIGGRREAALQVSGAVVERDPGDGKASVSADVRFSGLLPGSECSVHMLLLDAKTGNAVQSSGRDITAEEKFTPEASSGTYKARITGIDPEILSGRSVTIGVTFTDSSGTSMHWPDEKASLPLPGAKLPEKPSQKPAPSASATATAGPTPSSSNLLAPSPSESMSPSPSPSPSAQPGKPAGEPGVELTDLETRTDRETGMVSVSGSALYSGLQPGDIYTVRAVLLEAASGQPIAAGGRSFTSETELIPEAPSGTFRVIISDIPAAVIRGAAVTLGVEILDADGNIVAAHPAEDAALPLAGLRAGQIDPAVALDKLNAAENPDGTMDLEAVYSYDALTPGETYTVTGILIDKETGVAILSGGKRFEASEVLIPEKPSGTESLLFRSLDPRDFAGREIGLLLEVRDSSGKIIATNREGYGGLTGASNPGIRISGDGPEDPAGSVVISDVRITDDPSGVRLLEAEISYDGLAAGEEYELTGMLARHGTEDPLLDLATGSREDEEENSAEAFFQAFFGAKALAEEDARIISVSKFAPESAEGKVALQLRFSPLVDLCDADIRAELMHVSSGTLVGSAVLPVDPDLLPQQDPLKDPSSSAAVVHITDASISPETVLAAKNVTITGSAKILDLAGTETYTVRGELKDAESGKAVFGVTPAASELPEGSDGGAQLKFSIDASSLAGSSLYIHWFVEGENGEVLAELEARGSLTTVLSAPVPSAEPSANPAPEGSSYIPEADKGPSGTMAAATGDRANLPLLVSVTAAAAAVIILLAWRMLRRRSVLSTAGDVRPEDWAWPDDSDIPDAENWEWPEGEDDSPEDWPWPDGR